MDSVSLAAGVARNGRPFADRAFVFEPGLLITETFPLLLASGSSLRRGLYLLTTDGPSDRGVEGRHEGWIAFVVAPLGVHSGHDWNAFVRGGGHEATVVEVVFSSVKTVMM